jgi:hypothetical protein
MNKLYNMVQTLVFLGVGSYLILHAHFIAGGFVLALLLFAGTKYE